MGIPDFFFEKFILKKKRISRRQQIKQQKHMANYPVGKALYDERWTVLHLLFKAKEYLSPMLCKCPFVLNVPHVETGPRVKISSCKLEKPVIEPAPPGLHSKWSIHYTTAARVEVI